MNFDSWFMVWSLGAVGLWLLLLATGAKDRTIWFAEGAWLLVASCLWILTRLAVFP